MSNDKPLSNGHAPAKAYSQSGSAIPHAQKQGKAQEGALVLKSILIEPALLSVLVQCGWLNPVERGNREAVVAAIAAVVHQAVAAEMRPAQTGKLFVPVDMRALEAALCWLKRGEPINVETAGKAVGIVAKCASQVRFTPGTRLSGATDGGDQLSLKLRQSDKP